MKEQRFTVKVHGFDVVKNPNETFQLFRDSCTTNTLTIEDLKNVLFWVSLMFGENTVIQVIPFFTVKATNL